MKTKHQIRWPEEQPEARLYELVINVRPHPELPGKNVELLGSLLAGIRICHPCWQELETVSWSGKDIRLQLRSLERPDTMSQQARWASAVRILNYQDPDKKWGGPSDNMLTIGFKNMSGQEGAKWLVSFFRLNGHKDAGTCLVADGTWDVEVPSLFVAFKFNVLQ